MQVSAHSRSRRVVVATLELARWLEAELRQGVRLIAGSTAASARQGVGISAGEGGTNPLRSNGLCPTGPTAESGKSLF